MPGFIDFITRWKGSNEKSDTQKFWLDLLKNILDIEDPVSFIEFEKRVKIGNTKFIDAYIPKTHIIIEQKSADIDLKNSSAFEQAQNYYLNLPFSERGRFIVTCNFKSFYIYDMELPNDEPEEILLENLADEWKLLLFLVNPNARPPKEIREISKIEEHAKKAGELVKNLYDHVLGLYEELFARNDYKSDKSDELDERVKKFITNADKSIKHYSALFCSRVMFLLYAEDSGILDDDQFSDYLKKYKGIARAAINELFNVLNTKEEDRSSIDDDLKNFPYIDGGLFKEKIEIPNISGTPSEFILNDMSKFFNWENINPTIFGAIFESSIDPQEQRAGGMHYTSIQNIHRVIDPLFMNDLYDEFKKICSSKNISEQDKIQQLQNFRESLSQIIIFDPACGSGNFLTESYLSLRKLEHEIIKKFPDDIKNSISESKISLSQFYGIEINELARSVAHIALWISENQMLTELKKISSACKYKTIIPLKTYNKIIGGNALKLNWSSLLPDKNKIFIASNPPFLGYANQTDEQKNELKAIYVDEHGKNYRGAGKIDYVAGWYFKACELLQDTRFKAAFVSTNSVTQGEQVSMIFKPLAERFKIHIDFAHRSFVWYNEAKNIAHVHVVVIGFSTGEGQKQKQLYDHDNLTHVDHINFYLDAAPDVFIESRKNPLCDVPAMIVGNFLRDGGNLIIEDDDYKEFIKKQPDAKKFIRPYMMGYEFINNKTRYCLWLVDAEPDKLKKMRLVYERIKAVKKFRLASTRSATRDLAVVPWLFAEIRQPSSDYIAIPVVSSENRRYIPIGWLDKNTIAGAKLFVIPDADLYHFGILTSRVHMAWMRKTCGRLKSDYSYSNTVVYNNFVWPSVNEKSHAKIENTAKKILDARAKYNSSLASLYDENTMPPDLRKAHDENDIAVCEAYGFEKNISEQEIITKLFNLYAAAVNELQAKEQ